ncbi:hypothetical protein D9757_004920 [Collybiopsis confluens]|uniref:Uncharacterized protein n=1 Tax=Collybiopsis confluens TaxID=2823264 RepID=A0A8H5HT65_9AGAR|nr:hypothetical protein D9757_004920 [Collybiopsis confluens]
MDFHRESPPPPAYSERYYDKKLAASFELNLAISEDPEEEEDWDEPGREPAATSPRSTSTQQSTVRRLPPVPGQEEPKPLRIHKRTVSHSAYPASEPRRALPLGRSSHTRAASSQLQFDPSVAYASPEFSPRPASSRPIHPDPSYIPFNPSALYNTAVSPHLNVAPARLPSAVGHPQPSRSPSIPSSSTGTSLSVRSPYTSRARWATSEDQIA